MMTRLIALVFAAGLNLQIAAAQTESSADAQTGSPQETATAPAEAMRLESVLKLNEIKSALAEKRAQLKTLLRQLGTADDADKTSLSERTVALQKSIDELTEAFEKIAVSGVNLRSLDEVENLELDWRDELIQIARPLISSLKEATAKPRMIEKLRATIYGYEQQLKAIEKASASIELVRQQEITPAVAEGLDEVANSWLERRKDIERALELARSELRNLQVEDVNILESVGNTLHEFSLGRGLTLVLALVFGFLVWLAMRGVSWLVNYRRRSLGPVDRSAKMRLLLYVFHLVTMVLVALTVLTVFYVRGDVLLLSLMIIMLAMLTLGAWRFLPGYILEARLLLNVGAAREGERVIYNGLPFRISSLNLYSELRNPELEGVIRLPLSEIAQLTSRVRTDEDWFPCRVGEYVLLDDGGFGEVIQQTVETVQLKMVGAVVRYPSAEFLQLNVRNLSRAGFGVVGVFGIDYAHQAIALDRVPERFKSGLHAAFVDAGLADDLKDLLVDFKEAGTNSLDYLIFATMEGRSAGSYFMISRLIQQSCVDICNKENWGIPFTQITIHQATPVQG